jgi:site-specific DNA recombinase
LWYSGWIRFPWNYNETATPCALSSTPASENQRDASIDDQIRVCEAFIAARGWQLSNTYTDRASSGASSIRPGYQKLVEDSRSGALEVVVAESLDRLSRDQADTATLFKVLSFQGIQIVTVAEGVITELHVGLKGTMNALFLKDLAQKTRRGLEGRVRQGRSGGGLCFGYDLVSGETGARRINEAEAGIVRRIFREYAAGRSARAIAKRLNRDGIAGPQGREWRDTAIRGHATRGTGILNNELYIGRLVWNRLTYKKDPSTGRRRSRINGLRTGSSRKSQSSALWTRTSGVQPNSGRPVSATARLSRSYATRDSGSGGGRSISSPGSCSAAPAAAPSRQSDGTT